MPRGENVRDIVADNLRTLITYAADNRLPYCDAKSIGKRAGISGMTLGRWLKGSHAASIDALDDVARVFKLRAWQLLIPNLDPTNPPTVPYTDAERRLYWRIKQAANELAKGDIHADQEGAGPSAGRDPDPALPAGSARRTPRK